MKAIFALVLLAVAAIHAEVVNKDVTKAIDASSSIVRWTVDIKASGVEGSYDLTFPDSQASHLAFLSVTSKGKTLETSAPTTNGEITTYTVKVNEAEPNLKVSAVFTDVLTPFPKEIAQLDNQLVLLQDSHVFLSPYRTENQKTTIKLASNSVESYSKKSPSSHKGSVITYGPYKEVMPFDYSPATIHYHNNKPFAKFSTMHREIEVSHWGNIAVEEIYELKHHGAKLKGGFSRFDYQMHRQEQGSSPCFRSLVGVLPAQAHDIYYRDQIGNISTSEVRVKNKQIELEIETRFPIFGGWQTQFYIGYSLPTEYALFVDSATNTYKLKFDFFTFFENVFVEDMEVKVVLPEGATDIDVNVPYPTQQSRTKRFTYLDSELNGGRPVLILSAKNLVEEHDKQVIISYKFPPNKMIVEPLMLVSTFFVFFLLLSIIARIDVPKVKAEKKET